MNKELAEILKLYSTDTHAVLSAYLVGKSKDTLMGILVDLITMYINDKNSSSVREFITVALAGYEHREAKIGYNGFKQDSFVSGRRLNCEAKPKNFNTEEYAKYQRGERKTSPSKLNGGGNFTDYTPARLNKDNLEQGLQILVSGFVDGKLIYILEFPFGYSEFTGNLRSQLNRWENKLSGSTSTKGQFLRSANFDYRAFFRCPDLKVVYLLSQSKLKDYKGNISGVFYKFLETKALREG